MIEYRKEVVKELEHEEKNGRGSRRGIDYLGSGERVCLGG